MIYRTPMLTDGSSAETTLICFPFAGAGGHVLGQWRRHFSERISLRSVQLPGRGARMREPPIRSWLEMRCELVNALRPLADQRLVFFGHSMGALLAYDVACALRAERSILPVRLFVSGHRAPHLPMSRAPIVHLNDAEFLGKLKDLNGTPDEVLQSKELMALLLPSLRADIALVESYIWPDEDMLALPITALTARSDSSVSPPEVREWRRQTALQFTAHDFDGDHFYIFHHAEEIAALIEHYVCND